VELLQLLRDQYRREEVHTRPLLPRAHALRIAEQAFGALAPTTGQVSLLGAEEARQRRITLARL